ncbi:MAG: amidase domain-containing protein [Oscillospiraceae bacterium]
MEISLQHYDRRAAVYYAHTWAYGRNPAFYDYETIGGDCTNFASQCVFAGAGIMNFEPTVGWYYIDANQKSPSWTGVPYFYQFLTRAAPSVGPVARSCTLSELQPGDLVQLLFKGEAFQHTPVVVFAGEHPRTLASIRVAAHSYDADNRPLSSYDFQEIRFLHILGVNRP